MFLLVTGIALGSPAAEAPLRDRDHQEAHTDGVEASSLTREYPYPTVVWALSQLLPSPQVSFSASGQSLGALKWQLTPLSYAFGVHRRVSPWRVLVVDPFARYGGSVETYVSPIVFLGALPSSDSRLGIQAGVKMYLPLLEHGEVLAASLGTSYIRAFGQDGVSYDAGIYTLFGILGLETSWSPSIAPMRFTTSLRIRYM
jgi:hypothetical protein